MSRDFRELGRGPDDRASDFVGTAAVRGYAYPLQGFDSAKAHHLVWLALAASVPVHDALFKQGVVHAHDDAARDLGLAALQVYDQAAVLHGDHVRAADDAGFGVHHDFGDLHAADADVGQARRPVAL